MASSTAFTMAGRTCRSRATRSTIFLGCGDPAVPDDERDVPRRKPAAFLAVDQDETPEGRDIGIRRAGQAVLDLLSMEKARSATCSRV